VSRAVQAGGFQETVTSSLNTVNFRIR
jgi:hypothetical protein